MKRWIVVTVSILVAGAAATLCARGRGPELKGLEGDAAVQAGGDYERYLEHGGHKRRYELHVPPGYDPAKPMPLVLNYHGGGGNATVARRNTKMDAKADAAGFLVCYPEGTGRLLPLLTWNAGICCGYAMKNQVDDVGFTRAVLDDLEKRLSVDKRRVYATGLSNGAMISYRLGCELADRLAAIAPVAGALSVAQCEPSRPVPLLHIHGTADQNAPYEGGTGARSISGTDHKPVREGIERWKKFNHCSGPPEVTVKGVVKTERWKPDPGGAEVVLLTIEGGGHVWPGGRGTLPRLLVGKDVSDLQANDVLWEFFSRHALPAPK